MACILVRLYASLYPNEVAGMVLVDATHEQQVRRWGAIDSTYPAAFRTYFDSVLKTLPPWADAAETRETMRIQAAGEVEGMQPLPDMPLAVLTSMRVDPKARYVNGTARGHPAPLDSLKEWKYVPLVHLRERRWRIPRGRTRSCRARSTCWS